MHKCQRIVIRIILAIRENTVLDGYIPESLAVLGDQPLGNSLQAFLVVALLLFRLAEFQDEVTGHVIFQDDSHAVFIHQRATLEKFWFASVMDTMFFVLMFIQNTS